MSRTVEADTRSRSTPVPDGPSPRRRDRAARGRVGTIPPLLYVPAMIGLALLTLPILGLFLRVDWATVPAAITSPEAVDALLLSLRTSVAATIICVIVGVPLALVIARSRPRIAGLLRAVATLPLVLPPMVGGIALLYLLGRSSVVGQYLELAWGIRIPFTTSAVVIAQAFVALPFLVIALEGALRSTGTRFESVAMTLGASRWTVFRRITLPLVWPGLLAGTVLSFARALGEFGATALFAGNAAGVTRTMPLAIYTAFNGAGVSQDSAVALSLLLVAVAIVILLVVRVRRTELL